MKCPNCGSELPNGALFCENCHTRFAMPVNGVPSSSARMSAKCNRCGRLFPLSQGVPSFCPDCGNRLTMGVPSAKDDKKWTAGRFIALASILLAAVATFLPFFTVSVLGFSSSITLWEGELRTGGIVLCFALAVGLVLLLVNPNDLWSVLLIVGGFSLAVIVYWFFYNRSKLTETDAGEFWGTLDLSSLLNPGVGFYLIALGCIGLIVAGFVLRHERRS